MPAVTAALVAVVVAVSGAASPAHASSGFPTGDPPPGYSTTPPEGYYFSYLRTADINLRPAVDRHVR